jgi:three-Cys-motif partner protein
MSRAPKEYLQPADDDGMAAPEVGAWAEEKYRRLGMYAEIFSTGMKNRWGTRVYLDLFAGPGHAVIRETKQRILTSPLLALQVPHQFDKYIFCDADSKSLECLKSRVRHLAPTVDAAFEPGDVNIRAKDIAAHIPPHSQSHTVLSFCFVDPFGLDIHFETIRQLGRGRAMDFLILLALAMDATRNWQTYRKPENEKVESFLGNPTWRVDWQTAESHGRTPIRFLAEAYMDAMEGLGYVRPGFDRMIEVRTRDNNMRLYYLAFFSKSERGYEFWDEVRRYSTDQFGLSL